MAATQRQTPAPEDELRCDVLVVGYGPVGMTCAALLAHYGLNTVVVERHPTLYGLPRAGHLDSEAMRVYQRLGIAESIELIAQALPEAQIVTVDGEVLGQIHTGQAGSGWRTDYMSYQPDLEDILDDDVRRRGVPVYMGVTAEAIEQDADGVRTTVRSSGKESGPPRTIRSRYLIGADGASSFVRSAVGAKRLDLGFTAMPQLVIDYEFFDQDREFPTLDKLSWILDPQRPQLSGRYGGRRVTRLEVSARQGESREYLESEENCWKMLAPWGVGPADVKIIRAVVYEFESTLADRWRVGRVLLAGDAAHTMPPVLGQGMIAGVRDAANLTWKLAAVFAGEAEEAILDTYQAERAPHAQGVIETSMQVGDMVLAMDPDEARKRDEALRSGSMTQPEFPRLGEGLVRATGTSSVDGRPGPQYRVAARGRADRMDNFLDSGRGWRLISRHAVPSDLFSDRQREFLAALNTQYAHIHRGETDDDAYLYDLDADYHTWYLRHDCKAYMERPDHYVFGSVASMAELPALVDDLADVLAAHGWLAGVGKACSR